MLCWGGDGGVESWGLLGGPQELQNGLLLQGIHPRTCESEAPLTGLPLLVLFKPEPGEPQREDLETVLCSDPMAGLSPLGQQSPALCLCPSNEPNLCLVVRTFP